jgi:hypothetical protein
MAMAMLSPTAVRHLGVGLGCHQLKGVVPFNVSRDLTCACSSATDPYVCGDDIIMPTRDYYTTDNMTINIQQFLNAPELGV